MSDCRQCARAPARAREGPLKELVSAQSAYSASSAFPPRRGVRTARPPRPRGLAGLSWMGSVSSMPPRPEFNDLGNADRADFADHADACFWSWGEMTHLRILKNSMIAIRINPPDLHPTSSFSRRGKATVRDVTSPMAVPPTRGCILVIRRLAPRVCPL